MTSSRTATTVRPAHRGLPTDGRHPPCVAQWSVGSNSTSGTGQQASTSGVSRAAVQSGMAPNSISTDIHVRNINGPVFDLTTVMTKMLACGMTLPSVIRAVTDAPRATLGLVQPWRGDGGQLHHPTLFTLDSAAPNGRRYLDAAGHRVNPTQHLGARAAVHRGSFDRVDGPCRAHPTVRDRGFSGWLWTQAFDQDASVSRVCATLPDALSTALGRPAVAAATIWA